MPLTGLIIIFDFFLISWTILNTDRELNGIGNQTTT